MNANTKKFQATYTRMNEVEDLLNNRIESGMATWVRNDLMKEFKKLCSRLTVLSSKMTIEDFEALEVDLCMDYEAFQWSWDNTFSLDY